MAQERLIICNTSPLINLAEIDHLELLLGLPGAVCITPAVVVELQAKSRLFPKAALAANSERLRLLGPEDGLLVRSFAATLHSGESECLALAMENPGSLLVLDDLSARAAATANGLVFTGTLGILAAAKSRGQLAALAPVLQALKSQARFWINPRLEQVLLEQAGELE
jgi:predicted nucleic acid-binding protein